MSRFFISLLLTAIILGAFTWLASQRGLFPQPSFFLTTLIFLTFGTGLIFIYLYKATKPDFFILLYLLTMVLKLLAYCGYNLVIILKDKAGAIPNVVLFMVTYFVFTALEIGFLYRRIAGGNKP